MNVFKKLTCNVLKVSKAERALVFQGKDLVQVYGDGEYYLLKDVFTSQSNAYRYELFDFTNYVVNVEVKNQLWKTYKDVLESFWVEISAQAGEVCIVSHNAKIIDVVYDCGSTIYWKQNSDYQIERINLNEQFLISAALVKQIEASENKNLARLLMKYQVNTGCKGLVRLNEVQEKVLDSGIYYAWRFDSRISIISVDMRERVFEVLGQEILTSDKVSLRINLSSNVKVQDAELVAAQFQDWEDSLYKDFQMHLRELIGAQTLDELLSQKDRISSQLEVKAKQSASRRGLFCQSVGIKDIILHGEMKVILNKVVEAQKESEANFIRRREESAMARVLHNTAKLMESSQAMMRLKELEVLQEISQNVNHLNVYNGLNGLLKLENIMEGSIK